MNQTNNKKKMEFPHTLIIILIMIVFAAILTYLVQAGGRPFQLSYGSSEPCNSI